MGRPELNGTIDNAVRLRDTSDDPKAHRFAAFEIRGQRLDRSHALDESKRFTTTPHAVKQYPQTLHHQRVVRINRQDLSKAFLALDPVQHAELNKGHREQSIGLVRINLQRGSSRSLRGLRDWAGYGVRAIDLAATKRIGEQSPCPRVARLDVRGLLEIIRGFGLIQAQRIFAALHQRVEARIRAVRIRPPQDHAAQGRGRCGTRTDEHTPRNARTIGAVHRAGIQVVQNLPGKPVSRPWNGLDLEESGRDLRAGPADLHDRAVEAGVGDHYAAPALVE